MTAVVKRLRAHLRGVRVVGATVVSAFGGTNEAHGLREVDTKRRALNEFIRSARLFDAFVEFDRAALDPGTGAMRPDFVPGGTVGSPGDKLHPNREGYPAMALAIVLDAMLATR